IAPTIARPSGAAAASEAMAIRVPDEIETTRLILRRARPEDAEAVNEAVRESFAELKRWMDWAQEVPTVEQTRAYSDAAFRKFDARQEFDFRFWLREAGGPGAAGALVGCGGLHHVDWAGPRAEIGY